MGWRGALRSIVAAQRAAEREAVRRHREQIRLTKQEAKLEELRQAAFEVEQYENLVERIISMHHDCGETWDWCQIACVAEPPHPPHLKEAEESARQALEKYRPSFFDKLLGRIEKKRGKLMAAINAGRSEDGRVNALAQEEFAERHADWSEMRDVANRILANEPAAFRDAVKESGAFAEISGLGSYVSFAFREDGVAVAALLVNGESVIPGEVKSLLQSGKLSTKKMPQGRFYELYQDYVAGATLRIARELFALLPLQTVYVTAVGNMLDESTGHMEDQPILSVMIPRDTLQRLHFEALDPSESLRNFNHRMEFRKTKGLSAVEPLLPEGILLPSVRPG